MGCATQFGNGAADRSYTLRLAPARLRLEPQPLALTAALARRYPPKTHASPIAGARHAKEPTQCVPELLPPRSLSPP